MLFMIIVKASTNSEEGNLPSEELMDAMTQYNKELVAAGVRVMAKGLHPSSNGIRIFYGQDHKISHTIEGPFEDPHGIVAGFIQIDVESKEEALKWARKMPDPQGFGQGQIELRQIFEL